MFARQKQRNYEPIKSGLDTHVTLGFGTFGMVRLARCSDTKEIVAIKLIYKRDATQQIQLHKRLHHPHIVGIIDAYFQKSKNRTCIVLEYVSGGNLMEIINQRKLNHSLIKRIFYQVCKAVAYLHQQGIIHRDLKPQNILLTKSMNVKLCDFGFATEFTNPRHTLCGTCEYMAPEMLMGEPHTQKIDVWSLGILLYEMIQGQPPFKGQTKEQVMSSMNNQLQFSAKFSSEEISLLQSILKLKHSHRPQVVQILKQAYFAGLSESEQLKKLIKLSQMQQKPHSQCRYPNKIRLLDIKVMKSANKSFVSSETSQTKMFTNYQPTDDTIQPLSSMNSTLKQHDYPKSSKISLKGLRHYN